MDATALIEARNKARQMEVTLAEQLGSALLARDETKIARLQRELKDAEANTAALDRSVNAISAATQAAERARQEQEAREAREARAALIAAARADHADLIETAGKIDKVKASLDELLGEMDDRASKFIANYTGIGMQGQTRSWVTMRGWVREVLAHFKSQSHRTMVGALNGELLNFQWSGKPLAKTFPAFEALMKLKPDDIPEAEKEAA